MKKIVIVLLVFLLTSCAPTTEETVDYYRKVETFSFLRNRGSQMMIMDDVVDMLDSLNVTHEYEKTDREAKVYLISFTADNHGLIIIPDSNELPGVKVENIFPSYETFYDNAVIYNDSIDSCGIHLSNRDAFFGLVTKEEAIDDPSLLDIYPSTILLSALSYADEQGSTYRLYVSLGDEGTFTVFGVDPLKVRSHVVVLFEFTE